MITKQHFLLVCKIAHSFKRHDLLDELISVGCVALMRCANRFDANKAQLHSYAYHRIKGEMLEYLGKKQVQHDEIPVDYPSKYDLEKEADKNDFIELINNQLHTLTERQYEAIMLYLDGNNYRQIGEIMLISENRACQLLKECVRKIKQNLKEVVC